VAKETEGSKEGEDWPQRYRGHREKKMEIGKWEEKKEAVASDEWRVAREREEEANTETLRVPRNAEKRR